MSTKEQTARRPRYEAPSKEKQVLIKTLYQILQCLHHQRNFNTDEAGPKSFRKKQADLKKFLRPAQATQQFQEIYEDQVNAFMKGALNTMREHYNSRLDTLKLDLLIRVENAEEVKQAMDVALKWGKKNFKEKLSPHTNQEFQSKIAEWLSNLMDSPGNKPDHSLHNQGSMEKSDTPPVRGAVGVPQSSPGRQAEGSPDRSPTTKSPNRHNPPQEGISPHGSNPSGTGANASSATLKSLSPPTTPESTQSLDSIGYREGSASSTSHENSRSNKRKQRKNGGTGRTNSQRPKWSGPQSQPVAGLHTQNHGLVKSRWKIPEISSRVAILGDSNISRATGVNFKSGLVELHVFPGAKLIHFQQMLESSRCNQGKPQEVILSIGIHNRNDDPLNNLQQIRSIFETAARVFPNARIYIPQINASPSLHEKHKECLCDVNWGLSNISDLWEQKSKHITANLKRFKTFPKIPRRDFHIDPKDTKYSIHWTTDTANTIITRWLKDLNIPIMRQFRPSQV